MAPPGRAVAAVGSALRALVLNVLAVAVLGGLGAGVAGFAGSEGNGIAALFAFWLGVFFGGVAGGAAGGVHAAAQLLVMPWLPPHRRRPVSPAVATVVSAALYAASIVVLVRNADPGQWDLGVTAVLGAVYVLGTWPVANALVPPGRPRRGLGSGRANR